MVHFQPIKIKSTRQETKDCISVLLEIPENLKEAFVFQPGQHLTLRTNIGGQEIRRNYSLCSNPEESEWRIAIKKMHGGLFSNWAAAELKPGAIIDVLPPMGKFTAVFNPAQTKHYVAIAAGSGITPVMAIVKTALQTEPKSSFTLVYSNRDRNSIIFKEELEALKNRFMERFTVHHIFSREKTDAPIYEGRIDEQKCELIFSRLVSLQQVDDFFICGPGGLIDTVRSFLEKKQVAKEKIHFELFTAGTVQQPVTYMAVEDKRDDADANIIIKLDGTESSFPLSYNGESILDAALRQGADLPYACKSGVCCTCKAKILAGNVNMDANYGLGTDELAAGYILTCQSHPATPEVRIDFDA